MHAKPKLSILVFYLFCIVIAVQPIALTASNYITVNSGVYFKPGSSLGLLQFGSAVRSTQISFSDSYVHFNNFRFDDGDYSWSYLGFQPSSNSNVTLTKADRTSVEYTVYNLSDSQTTQKIIFPAEWDEPTSVSGAWNWGYSGRTLTVTALPSSPQNIRITFSSFIEEVNTINSRILGSVGLFAIVPIVLGAVLLMASLKGDIDPKVMIQITVIILVQAVIIFALMAGVE